MAHCTCGLLKQATFSSLKTRQLTSCKTPLLQHRTGSLSIPHGLRKAAQHSRTQGLLVQAAATAQAGKLIASTEIPAFIPRQDLMDQLTRWAYNDIQEEGARKFGLPCKASVLHCISALQRKVQVSIGMWCVAV